MKRMARKLKSVEELREAGRVRAKRWRAKNLERARALDREWKRVRRSRGKGTQTVNTRTAEAAPGAKPLKGKGGFPNERSEQKLAGKVKRGKG